MKQRHGRFPAAAPALFAGVAALLLAGCHRAPPAAPGTLEYDRITLPAPASEPVLTLEVHEGQVVAAGAVIATLDAARLGPRQAAASAEVERARQVLRRAQAGARRESRTEAVARVRAAEALRRNADQQLERVRALVAQRLVPAAQLDEAEAAARSARAEQEAAAAASAVLANGSRAEDVAEAAAALAAAEASARAQGVDLSRLVVRAPRAGRVDSLPYKVGDQPPVGAPLAVLLVGEAPYARVFVPAPALARFAVGRRIEVRVEGDERTFTGTVRAVRSEASFTPYYALSGQDASRLAYLVEVQLGKDAAALPVGLPLQALLPSG